MHRILRTSLFLALCGALTLPSLAETREEELRRKEAELEKKQAELERQRMELEAAKKQLGIEETEQRVTIRLEGDVLFDFGKSTLRPEAQQALEKVGVVLARFPRGTVVIEGFTDSRGKPGANFWLSSERALAVQEFLKKRGDLAGLHVTTCGWGAKKPIATNDTEEGRRRNRRVEIAIDKPIPAEKPLPVDPPK